MNKKITSMTSPLWKFALKLFSQLLPYTLSAAILYLFIILVLPDNFVVLVLVMIAVLLMSLFSLYSTAWHFGQRDHNLVKYGHIPYQAWRGLWASAIAATPVLLGLLILFLGAMKLTILFIAIALLVVIACTTAYILGHKCVSIGDKLIYKNPKKVDKRTR